MAHSNTVDLSVQDIFKTYDGAPLLRGISFEIPAGEIACLLGPSGGGKTTLLRIIAGLEEPEGGRVLFRGQDLRSVPTHERGLGFMFQDLALFPHRTVFENVAFGLRMQNRPSAEIRSRVAEALALVGLGDYGPRNVVQLSGGEQQRVALARTLAPRPRLIMFDEPLGALDRILREQIAVELREIVKRVGLTGLYVTHDQSEAFTVADRILILHEGAILQEGTPEEVYRHPKDSFVARFLGLDNLVRVLDVTEESEQAHVQTEQGEFRLSGPAANLRGARWLLLRPEALAQVRRVDETGASSTRRMNTLGGRVLDARFRAGEPRLILETAQGARFTFDWNESLAAGTPVLVELDPAHLALLP